MTVEQHHAGLDVWVQQRSFSAMEVLQIMRQVIEALHDLHSAGEIHQHIAPSTILWSPDTGTASLHNSKPDEKHRSNSLLYIAPEQTGKVSRKPDHRTDFYSLGVTAWHLLVGYPPFQGEKKQTLIHAHLACRPDAPHTLRDDIPAVLSTIILKLMAKHPEERYQTASGLLADMHRCAETLAQGSVAPFLLGQYDQSLELTTSRHLYGRESELQLLQEKLHQAREGNEVVLVRGAPGVGKTTLVQSLKEAVYTKQYNFATGRFEQFQKESPYLALQTALRGLLQQLLATDSPRLLFWQTRIKQVLSKDSLLLSPYLPELSYFVEDDEEALQLLPQEEQIRLHKAFHALIRTLSSSQRPLVLFLDDLQWSDVATLEFLEFLVTSQEIKGLFLILGFRDTKADESEDLQGFLESLKDRNVPATTLALQALTMDDVQQMLLDFSRGTLSDVEELAQVLWSKTRGNPFFLKFLLRQLQQERLLWLDEQGWSWDKGRSQTYTVTDNVVELLMESLKQQPEESQRALQLAACLGNPFRLAELALLFEANPEHLLPLLQPGVNAGLLLLEDSTCRFVHGRVHEAAYALFSEEERAPTHLRIARQLLAQTPEPQEAELVEVLRHLQKGFPHIQRDEDRRRCAQLALKASEWTRNTRAFESSFAFLDWGLIALGEQRWEDHYELSLSLAHLAVEVGSACRGRKQVDIYIEEILTNARSLPDQLPAWMAKIRSLISKHKMKEAVDATNRFFALTGHPLIQRRPKFLVFWDLVRTLWLLGRRTPEEMLELPEVKDPVQRTILDIQLLVSSAYVAVDPEVLPTMILRDVRGALQHGMAGYNVQSWSGMGTLFAGLMGRIALGERYGDLGLKQIEKLNRPDLWPRIAAHVYLLIKPWTTSFTELASMFQLIVTRAHELGDQMALFGLYSLFQQAQYYSGTQLDVMHSQLQSQEQLRQQYQYQFHSENDHLVLRCVEMLQALEPPQDATLKKKVSDPKKEPFTHWFYTSVQLHFYLLFAQHKEAFDLAKQTDLVLMRSPMTIMYRGPHWTYALVSLYYGIEQGWSSRWKCRKLLREGHKQLRTWAKYLPERRRYRLTWVKAAKLRSKGRGFEAVAQYDKAFQQAQSAGFQHDAALIAEQAASLCDALGHSRFAQNFRMEALSLYQSWGAWAKVAHLSPLHEKLLSDSQQQALLPIEAGAPNQSQSTQVSAQDLEMIVAAADALTQESDQKLLLQKLMNLVMEHAGAERGLLLLHRHDAWKIVAKVASPDAEVQLPNSSIDLDVDSNELSTAMLRYTALTYDPVVLDNASLEGPFVQDPYVIQTKPRSVLCFPIVLHSQLIGIMVLENNQISGVFDQKRQTLLHLSITQAAISLQLLQNLNSTEVVLPSLPYGSVFPHPTPYPHSHTRQTLDEPLLQVSKEARVPLQEEAALANEVIGDWQLVRQIAEGGMSTIYEAYNKYTGQRAALKLLISNRQEQKVRTRRFRREARLLEGFNHPNIISLLDFDTDPRFGSFMALEYLEGKNLQAVLEQHAPVPLSWLLAVSEQLCDALSVVHNKGILHRDLKPSNIFLSPGEHFPHVCLLDFGIADVSRITQETKLTSTGMIVGTPAYLAPEQLKEKETLTTATDLYALGVIWFEALTGKHPMGGGSSVELFVKILQEEPTRLGQLRPELRNTELETLLSQLFAKNPEHRPSDIELLWNELSMSCQFLDDPLDTPDRYPTLQET